MNEWKDLDIGNIPSDFFVNEDYEIEFRRYKGDWRESGFSEKYFHQRFMVIRDTLLSNFKYRYRLKEPKAPSHEEIMTKWWENDEGRWHKVITYSPCRGYFFANFDWCTKAWFIGRESADIPPEAE